jgi:prepilin peptidase CpaA
MTFENWSVLAIALAACFTDLRHRRIPNMLVFGAAVTGLVFSASTTGWRGLGTAALGWLVGLGLLLPLFLLRGIGGGDVKLLAAIGAWLGPGAVVRVALWSAIAAAPLALMISARHGYTRKAIGNVWSLLTFWRAMGMQPHPAVSLDSPGSPRLPYALPVLVGVIVVIWRG